MRSEIVMMNWECEACGNDVAGSEIRCPTCGDSKSNASRFHLPDEPIVVTEAEQLRIARLGPNWYCSSCGGSNRADRKNCHSCGNPYEGSDKDGIVRNMGEGEAPRDAAQARAMAREEKLQATRSREAIRRAGGSVAPAAANRAGNRTGDFGEDLEQFGENLSGWHEPAPQGRPSRRAQDRDSRPAPKAPFPKKQVLIGLGAALGVFLIGFLIWAVAIARYDAQATVTSTEWSRSIEIEDYRTLREQDWDIPSGGRYVSERQKVHHTVQEFSHNETRTEHYTVQVRDGEYACGTRDLGNGYAERQYCPSYRSEQRSRQVTHAVYVPRDIYATWYTYDIERWVTDHYARSAGQNEAPYWPETILPAPKKREGDRIESYWWNVSWGEEGETDKITFRKPEVWETVSSGETFPIKVNWFGAIMEHPYQ